MNGTTINHKSEFILKNVFRLMILSAIFVIGVAAGALFITSLDEGVTKILYSITVDFFKQRATQSIKSTFIFAFASNASMMALCVFAGFSAGGIPLIFSLPWFKGLSFGVAAASLFVNYGYRVYGYLMLLIMPNTVISTIALIFCCNEAVKTSQAIFFFVTQVEKPASKSIFGNFVGKSLLLTIVITFGALVECLLYYNFAYIFF